MKLKTVAIAAAALALAGGLRRLCLYRCILHRILHRILCCCLFRGCFFRGCFL